MPAPEISVADAASDELVGAFARLTPQLSQRAEPPTALELGAIIAHDACRVVVARVDGTIAGALTLAVFPIPTGTRAWVEDVVVDEAARGRGIGKALLDHAVALATASGAKTVDLTSRPAREAANRLYARAGFARRETNVYRLAAEEAAAPPPSADAGEGLGIEGLSDDDAAPVDDTPSKAADASRSRSRERRRRSRKSSPSPGRPKRRHSKKEKKRSRSRSKDKKKRRRSRSRSRERKKKRSRSRSGNRSPSPPRDLYEKPGAEGPPETRTCRLCGEAGHISRDCPNEKQARNRRFFVGGLPWSITQQDFRGYFEQFGVVTEAVVMINRETNRSKGFGYVTFENEEMADKVETGKGAHKIHDKVIDVKPYDSNENPKAGKGGGKGFPKGGMPFGRGGGPMGRGPPPPFLGKGGPPPFEGKGFGGKGMPFGRGGGGMGRGPPPPFGRGGGAFGKGGPGGPPPRNGRRD